MAQSKCPDPATSGSEHSGAQHLLIFSPHTTQRTHSATRPATPHPESLGGRTPAFLTCSQHTRAIWFLAPRPIHIWLGALGGQTMVFDHPTFSCFLPLQPLALSTLRPRRSGASLGQTVQHVHTSFPRHTTHRNSLNQLEKQTQERFRKTNLGETETEQKRKANTNLNIS